jgi:hypothetical protein
MRRAAQEELFIKFAEFEERCKEHERARAIYRYALDHIPKAQAEGVYQRFVQFEKQHGDREGIEVGCQFGGGFLGSYLGFLGFFCTPAAMAS